jgi:ApbE superfamily uncharacterized protein (UPF0280 family)
MPPFISTEINNPHAETQNRDPESFCAQDFEPGAHHSELLLPIQVMSPELILVDWGPMTLTLSVWADKQPRPVMAVQSAVRALELLDHLAEYRNLLKVPAVRLKKGGPLPDLIKRAVSACRKVSPDLTGMAAVAGLVGDEIVKFALSLGGDRIIVNNGGDIALGMKGEQKIRVGLKDPYKTRVSYVLEIFSDQGIGGVATSGWGGRSFSVGIADAVSVWAADSVTADAAATWIAGQMRLDSPKVVQRPAKELDPETDIPHLLITRWVDPLAHAEIENVLTTGEAVARDLIEKEVIRGAFLAVQGNYRWIAFQKPFPEIFENRMDLF